MDRNRFILALTLSLVVLVAWQVGVRYFYPPVPQPPITETFSPIEPSKPPLKPGTPAPAPTLPTVRTTSTPQREIQIVTPYWKARFSNKGAVATSWVIEKYQAAGVERKITSADGGELELIPQDAIEKLGAPFEHEASLGAGIGDPAQPGKF